MNSYPSELLNHHFACMLVAGLTPSESTSTTPEPSELFSSLCQELIPLFNARGRSTVWDPARGRAAVFHSILVQHSVRLPPLKTRPSGTEFTNLPPRSPLSPLHPSSPLFPNGLIAPIWTRKHRELVPSVFVAFHCLAQMEQGEQTPESGQALRNKDEELIRLIAERKRGLTERGIKMTVVLLTTRTMLEDPSLEARLSYIRRTSGLDSRASLFVLTPVSKQELGEFITSLHSALYESALDFYREHAKRVKRKRARYPPPPSIIQPILSAAAQTRTDQLVPLSREGWVVRAEYKLGTFAELQGDNEEALLRYQEAYDILSGPCLGSTMLLPPRTKRWAEAKVLADTLSIKLAKFHLYKDNGAAAVRQLHRHLHRFTELSTGWGIGSMTFEYWSWLCKQYRMFADLVDAATRAVPSSPLPPFQLPQHAPPLPSKLLHPDEVTNGVPPPVGMLTPNQAALSSGVSPAALIQGPGTFYYLAALCTIERRDRFTKMKAVEGDNPALQHEEKVDYTAQITEQLTRAYESFKRSRMQRLSLFVASKIALTYLEGKQYEMALRFLERIIRSYRRDGCDAIQTWLLTLAAECALEIKDAVSAAKVLYDVLALQVPIPEEQRSSLAQLVEAEKPSVEIEAVGLLHIETVFLDQEVDVGAPAAFQLRVTVPTGSKIGGIQFELMEIKVEGQETPILVRRKEGENGQIVKIADGRAEAELRWDEGVCKVFQGIIVPQVEGPLELTSLTLITDNIRLDFPLSTLFLGPINDPRWLLRPGKWLNIAQREKLNTILVRPRTYRIKVEAEHEPFGMLDERFEIHINMTNEDTEGVEVSADIALQPAYEGGDDVLACEPEAPSAHITDHSCGTLAPGSKQVLTFHLTAARREGVRTVDLLLRFSATSEKSLAITIPVIKVFDASFSPHKSQPKRRLPLLTFDSDNEEDVEAEMAVMKDVQLQMLAERIEVESVDVNDSQDLLGEWQQGDRFAASTRQPAVTIQWRRPGTDMPPFTTKLSYTPKPTPQVSPLVISATFPSTVHLDTPFELSLTLANNHPTKSASLVITIESSDTFVFAGPRRMAVPFLLAGEERQLKSLVRLVPLVMGKVELPRLAAWIGEEEVRIEFERGRSISVLA